jgi:putative ATP-dependent endonuclease of OLD family
MRLVQARIRNFRSLKDVTVDFGVHTAFIGGNGAGKSSILKAVERFYATAKNLDLDDWYGRDTSQPVEIELTFGSLSDEEVQAFESRVRDGRLTVARVFDGTNSSGRYHGVVPQNPEFKPLRETPTFAARRGLYNDLRAPGGAYADLPAAAASAALDEALANWETNHADGLVLMRDDGQFFGFQNASRGALQRYTSFVFIPAVREAAIDAADAKSSPIQQLLVRSAILQRADLKAFQADVNARYQVLTAPENMPELAALGDSLTADLQRLYADAAVGLAWRAAGEMPIPLPAADVSLSHDGFGGPVDRQGHGLQRAFIFTLLQQLARTVHPSPQLEVAEAQAEPAPPIEPQAAPSLILAIEEPELYQHPTKQRHLASVLRKLSEGTLPGAEGPTQIAFASHSPMFVSMPNVDEIRFVRRVSREGGDFKECELKALDLGAVAQSLEFAAGKPAGTFTAESLQARLHILGPELSEGFFADAIVLVEGRSDKAALVAVADQLGVSFEGAGIAVLSAEGKTCIDRPLLIFRELGIPTYPIWDCDSDKPPKDARPEQNLLLLRAAQPGVEDNAPPQDTRIEEHYACFAANLETILRAEITPAIYDLCLETVCDDYGAGRADAQKNPEIMKALLAQAADQGASSPTLKAIVRRIWTSLKGIELPEEVVQE